ncbi:hypothetical protein F5B22DRAFT_213657 [Xylaria bambusicola]|uniref:uncharacterized protein n=1 Tax=Xylaria bambusicola TaxID=326684 RepID=UPI0020080568|nr:uncharacterized protein F5B22DRAFT_213657 [Xylaria bambusicola]KAI0515023.1 hypothetical protein F5B22DRAFT_213657 [Xylaria bambusicola]
MGDPTKKLVDELASRLDEATILSITGDYDLSKSNEFATAREVLLSISENVSAEEATGFNPSGSGGYDLPRSEATESDFRSNDELTTNTETLSSPSRDTLSHPSSPTFEREVPGIIHVSVLDGLTHEEKVGQLASMFVSLKYIDVKLALQKAKGDANLAIDELLNLQMLEQTGERPKGIDGFYKSDDDAPLSKKQERKKKKKVAKVAASRSADAATAPGEAPAHDDHDDDNIKFLSDNFMLPLDDAADVYQRNKCSLGAAIIATLESYIAINLPPETNPNQLRQIEEQQKRVTWIPYEYFSPIFDITASSQAAVEIINALADHFEKPAYIKYDVSYNAAASGLELASEPDEINTKSSWKTVPSSSSKLPLGRQLRTSPTALQEAGATKAALAASAKHSYASASSTYKKGKSDPLMRQAAAFYAERGRTEAANYRQVTSMEASLLVDQQSTGDVIDLHGVSVQDGVDIAIDRVWGWWNSLGENKLRKARANGLEIITGYGRHSSDGKSRLRINVFKALVADGWRVQVLTGSYLVTGRI